MLAAEEREVRGILGPLVFGVDDETMESAVLDAAAPAGTVAGTRRVGHGRPGRRAASPSCRAQSEVFKGSVVSYATEVKQRCPRRARTGRS